MTIHSTLCYLKREDRYLMLHRTKKENDLNKDKWLGVGGKFENGESPEECVSREVAEETGYELRSADYRGFITFAYGEYADITEYMHLFTSEDFSGRQKECNEGELEWVRISEVCSLPIWEGDKLFFELLERDVPFFTLKLYYDNDGNLVSSKSRIYGTRQES